jgi:hypothetical protein
MPREIESIKKQSIKNTTGDIEHIQTLLAAFLPPAGICPGWITGANAARRRKRCVGRLRRTFELACL